MNLTILCLNGYFESFYIDIISKQIKITILSQFLVKHLKWYLLLFQQSKRTVVFTTGVPGRFPVN